MLQRLKRFCGGVIGLPVLFVSVISAGFAVACGAVAFLVMRNAPAPAKVETSPPRVAIENGVNRGGGAVETVSKTVSKPLPKPKKTVSKTVSKPQKTTKGGK